MCGFVSIADFSRPRNTGEYDFAVITTPIRAGAVAVLGAALVAFAPPAGQADPCNAFAPGIVGPGCPPDINTGDNNSDSSQSGSNSWPPGADFGVGGGGGNGSAPPIVTPAGTP